MSVEITDVQLKRTSITFFTNDNRMTTICNNVEINGLIPIIEIQNTKFGDYVDIIFEKENENENESEWYLQKNKKSMIEELNSNDDLRKIVVDNLKPISPRISEIIYEPDSNSVTFKSSQNTSITLTDGVKFQKDEVEYTPEIRTYKYQIKKRLVDFLSIEIKSTPKNEKVTFSYSIPLLNNVGTAINRREKYQKFAQSCTV